ncbi:MAG: NADH:ubiquinone oxidoreductase subunit NDUFA12 [Alphaproteobacteria bacterium]
MLGVLSPTYMTFFGMIARGEKVGEDMSGNSYYRGKPRPGTKRERRWVMYKGIPEATNIPPEWHGWMHHQTNTIPANESGFRREWQKPHKPNMTGTTAAYRPPGHILAGGQRDKATGDYEAWRPPE